MVVGKHGDLPSPLRPPRSVQEMKTMAEQVCDYCGEPVGDKPVRRGSRVYCCEACAFEATRSKDCGGRADSHLPFKVVEPLEQ